MNKKLAIITALVVAATLSLSGCGADEPAPGTGNSAPTAENFKAILLIGGLSESQVAPGPLEVLMDYGRTVCDGLDEGLSAEDLNKFAYDNSRGDLEFYKVFLAASVAATALYCPKYINVWE